MNTILQKRIEEASINYTMMTKPICIAGDAFVDMAREINKNPAFIAGANYILSHQWISVEEALPTEKVVIAKLSNDFCGKDDCYEILHCIAKEHIDLKHPDGYYDSCGENVPTNAITYWMSIPGLKGGEK